ncbi:MAG: hypothetical protein RL770_2372, partial [Pseudomonadota bacterium]
SHKGLLRLNLGVWVMGGIVNQNRSFQGLTGSNLSKDP